MTSQSSKSRPTTRANTLTWTPFELGKRLELAVLGAWLATVMPIPLPAAEPTTVGRATLVSDPSPRSAADRWKRLKSLYPLSEINTGTIEADDDIRPAKLDEVFRPIPDAATGLVQPPVAEQSVESGSNGVIDTTLEDQPQSPLSVTPIAPLDEEPAWVLPATVTPETIPEASAATSASSSGTTTEPRHIVPAPVSADARPARSTVVARSNFQQVSQQAQIAPVRVRPIGTILPVYDPESDREIRDEAAYQSKELAKRFGGDHFGPDPYSERAFPEVVKPWEAPNFHYHPLYFEDPALERYGHTYPALIQPLASIGRFSTQLVFLPYQMTLDPPCREVYALGYYRPGEVAPKLHYQVPLNAKAAAVQAATVTGLVFLIP